MKARRTRSGALRATRRISKESSSKSKEETDILHRSSLVGSAHGIVTKYLTTELPEAYKMENVSSLNLRKLIEDDFRRLGESEQFDFQCTLCKKVLALGKDSQAYVRVQYIFMDSLKEVHICDRCLDYFCDACRVGPSALSFAHRICSRTTKVSMLQEDLLCYSCLGSQNTHLVFKFGDWRWKFRDYTHKRICARCAISFIEMMLNNKDFKKFRYLKVSCD